MKHDPKQLAEIHAAYSARIDAATAAIDAEISALEKRKSAIIAEIHASHKTFPDGLIYSATARCKCGAGLCYEEAKAGINGCWTCSVCALAGTRAHQAFPFREYEIKSETQPSAFGATTRPDPAEVAP